MYCKHCMIIILILIKFYDINCETIVDVSLWDEEGVDCSTPSSGPPRFVIGTLGVLSSESSASSFKQYFTFDLGNPKESLLMVDSCLGCPCQSSGMMKSYGSYKKKTHDFWYEDMNDEDDRCCPSVIPESNPSCSFCWPDHSTQGMPSWAFSYLANNHNCPDNIPQAGSLPDGAPACIQCFDDGDHSRFFVLAQSDELAFVNKNNKIIHKLGTKFQFGALVRTVPIIDRVWSNIGLGYKSSFLTQTELKSFMFHLRPGQKNNSYIIFHPSPARYKDAQIAKYQINKGRRVHEIEYFMFGNTLIKSTMGHTFHMDTGDDGVAIGTKAIQDELVQVTQGDWRPADPKEPIMHNQRLFVPFKPSNAPTLTVTLMPSIPVIIPGNVWVIDDFGRTIFFTAKKNILGLPFLSHVDIAFDDLNHIIRVIPRTINDRLYDAFSGEGYLAVK